MSGIRNVSIELHSVVCFVQDLYYMFLSCRIGINVKKFV